MPLEKIIIQSVNLNDSVLSSLIYCAIGNPSPEKVLEVIESYKNADHSIIGAFIGVILIGVLGFCTTSEVITISHMAVVKDYQRRGIGTLLLEEIKEGCQGYKIIGETDQDAIDFYVKSGFICHEFNGSYGNLRYKCEFNLLS